MESTPLVFSLYHAVIAKALCQPRQKITVKCSGLFRGQFSVADIRGFF